MSIDDYRLAWLADRTLAYLNENDKVLFSELLNRDEGQARKLLLSFLDADLTSRDGKQVKVVYFYKTFYDKIIEEEIIVAEPAVFYEPPQEDTPPVILVKKKAKKKTKNDQKKKKELSKETDGDVLEDEAVAEAESDFLDGADNLQAGDDNELNSESPSTMKTAKKRKKTGKKVMKGNEKGKVSPRTAVQVTPPPSEEPQLVYNTKVVEKVVQTAELHLLAEGLEGSATHHDMVLVYFLRNQLSPVPKCDHFRHACSILPRHFLVGSIRGNYLYNVQYLVEKVFSAVVDKQFRHPDSFFTHFENIHSGGDAVEVGDGDSRDTTTFPQFMPPSFYRRFSVQVLQHEASLKVESPETVVDNVSSAKSQLIHDFRQLSKIIRATLNHLEEEITLEMPDVDFSSENQEEIIPKLTQTVTIWVKHIGTVISQTAPDKMVGDSPLEEVSFWQTRLSTLSLLFDQLHKPPVQEVLDFVSKSNVRMAEIFKSEMLELNQKVSEARENVNCLSTILRYLKIVSHASSYEKVKQVLPNLVEGLRMIWNLSRYYNDDDTMIPLMKRISLVLCRKVSLILKSETLFKQPLQNVLSMTREAHEMLTNWKASYLRTRLKIEESGGERRWEFDQKKLFSETDYIALVCTDLHNIALVVNDFLNVFGPELKSIIKDPSQVDSVVKRVENLVLGIEMTDFDIYKPSCRDNWHAVVETFYKDVVILERDAKFFIDQAFLMLKSSEDALEALLKFKGVRTRDVIKSKLLTKFDVVLEKLVQQVSNIQDIFNCHKKKPPILRYQPPESGAIFWERMLFLTLKKAIVRFKEVEDCKDSVFRREAFESYIALAQQMKEYENKKFENWRNHVMGNSVKQLQKSILKLEHSTNLSSIMTDKLLLSKATRPTTSIHAKSSKSSNVGISRKGSESMESMTSSLVSADHVLSDLNVKLEVNFSDDIFKVMAEAELMGYLGFKVPQAIRNIVLQKERLHIDLTSVRNMVTEYQKLLSQLSPELLQFTRDFILNVQKHILPGYTRLNWNSLGIGEYVKSCALALKQLLAIVQQTGRIDAELNNRISLLENFNFFIISNREGGEMVHNCKVYFDLIHKNRSNSLKDMVTIYRSIGPLLIKLESLIHHSNSGRSPKMKLLYSFWGNKICETFALLLIKNLSAFEKSLNADSILFDVNVELSRPHVVIQPSAEDLHNLIMKSAVDCIERFKIFPKWLPNTCITPEAQQFGDTCQLSFYEDIKLEASDILAKIQTSAINLAVQCKRKIWFWSRYSMLWTQDISAKCNTFSLRSPPLGDFDEKLSFYSMIATDVTEMPPYEVVHSVRLNFMHIINSVQELCQRWKQELGERLISSTRNEMNEFQATITDLSCNLTKRIETLDDFKEVLKTISTIQKSTVASEIKYEEFEEVYHILSVHKINVSEPDYQLSRDSKLKWQQLYVASLIRSHELQPTKEKFSAICQNETALFLKTLESFVESYYTTGPGAFDHDISSSIDVMKLYKVKFDEYEMKRQELLTSESLFGLPAADYTSYIKINSEFRSLELLFEIYEQLINFKATTSSYLWAGANIQYLQDSVEELLHQFHSLRTDVQTSLVGMAVEKCLKEQKTTTLLMSDLKSDTLVERHWQILMDKTNVYFDLGADKLTLENLYDMNLFEYPGVVEEIIHSAGKEKTIEVDVKDLTEKWSHFSLCFLPHLFHQVQRSFIMSNGDEIIASLEEDAMKLQIMSVSRFIGPFLKVVGRLEKTLSLYGDIVDTWLEVQRKWLRLEAIFIGSDLKNQLPEETRKFEHIDKCIRRITTDAAKRPILRDFCEAPGRLDEILLLDLSLEECKKALSLYLQLKQDCFPRFYFLSDDELLSVLGHQEPVAIQIYLIKMFNNVSSFLLKSDLSGLETISGLMSSENEVLNFRNTVVTFGKIEEWMNVVLNEMKSANKFYTKKAIYDYGKSKQNEADWIIDNAGMIAIAASQVWWTAEVEETFMKIAKGDNDALKHYSENLNQNLSERVHAVQGQLLKNERSKLNISIIIAIHQKNVVDKMVKLSVTSCQSFEWESQLRFYWKKKGDDLFIEQCSSIFEYGHEYLGLSGRLAITPLTDRIYLTITQALSLHLGCAPTGPAATGKTETVKDMAKALGLLCIITNCGALMDSKSVGKILAGLCQCGAWGCFDEFNRIDISVLSVISSQIYSIRNALILKLARFNIDNQEVGLDKKVGLFITINPGYAGRNELPQSIKLLFRPVVCVMPDLEMICYTLLLSEGFVTAKKLSKKISLLYSLCNDQLSKQSHYDFGLRALKSVLLMAGDLKKESVVESEELIAIKALRIMNISKLIEDDVPLFLGIINDLFPVISENVEIIENSASLLISNSFENNSYTVDSGLIEKVGQLKDTLDTRHATMLVGPTGGGKTTIFNVLLDVYKANGSNTFCYTLNPKACSLEHLYGWFDSNSRNWTDGLLPIIFRQVNKSTNCSDLHFIVFDGDVDALWVENMNSIMDDNKLLTLVNGERIPLQHRCKLLFEVGNLKHASPASVSRAGMVYVGMSNQAYCWYWNRWLKSGESHQYNDVLSPLFEKYIHAMVRFVEGGWDGVVQGVPLRHVVQQTALNMTVQLCSLLDATLPKKSPFSYGEDESEEGVKELVESIFVQNIMYSFGATLCHDDRPSFDNFVKRLSGMLLANDSPSKEADVRFLPATEKTLFDYFVNIRKRSWQSWKSALPNYQYDHSIRFEDIFVPTADTCRAEWIIDCLKKSDRPAVFIGAPGSGKTTTIKYYLKRLANNAYSKLNINFSYGTSSNSLLQNLMSSIDKRTKHVYGPKISTRLVIFIDDLNMPRIDSYETQQPIAFLKHLFEFNGFYNTDSEHTWIKLCDSYFIAAMANLGGQSRTDPRFLSKFSIFNMTLPLEDSLTFIYKSIIDGHVVSFSENVKNIISALVTATVKLLTEIKIELPSTPKKFHYIFSQRDLSRITLGLLQTEPDGFKSESSFLRVWRNETTRVFCDRLIVDEDIELVKSKIAKIIDAEFPESAESALRNPLLFGDFRNACRPDEQRRYEDLLDYEAVYFLFNEILEEYSETIGTLQMVLFDHAVEYMTRIHRVLRLELGHMILVGESGSGKKTMTRLAGYAADYQTYELSISQEYNLISLLDDIRKLYRIVGLENRNIVFIFSDSNILDEGFLDVINNMLTIGVTPSLFSDDDRNEIIQKLSEDASKLGVDQSKDTVWNYFCNRCKYNLHIILTMSPLGDCLRKRCRNFPSLINCTTINWVFPWPEEALLSVSNAFLAENPEVPEIYRLLTTKHFVHVHTSMNSYTEELFKKYHRKTYVAPKHYLSFIDSFIQLLKEKNQYIASQSKRLLTGLDRIASSRKQLLELNEKLAIQQLTVESKTLVCEQLLKNITDSKSMVVQKETETTKRKQEIVHQERIIKMESKEAQEILDIALPALESAKLALNDLEKSDLTEIRSFTTPPLAIQTVCECILYLLGIKDVSWKGAKAVMSDPNFIVKLRELNCDQITLTQQRLCKGHAKNLPPDLNAASSAAHGLMMFVQAVLNYCSVLREIKPKKERAAQLELENSNSEIQISKIASEISHLDEMLINLNKQYEEASRDKIILQNETDLMSKRLKSANSLLTDLQSEEERWKMQLKQLESVLEPNIGDSLHSASFLTYLGPFPHEMRMSMLNDDWKCNILQNNIPMSRNLQINYFLSDEVQMSKWVAQGLPSDDFSFQNGILAQRGNKFPILIDPQKQAIQWIRNREDKLAKYTSFREPDYLTLLQVAIETGKTIVFEDVDEFIDPLMENVIEKQFTKMGDHLTVVIGEEIVKVNPEFRLYLISYLANPAISPGMFAKATVINFSVTPSGLEELLLSVIVRKESPDVEESQEMLINNTWNTLSMLSSLEDSLLHQLSSASTDLLDNEGLLESLKGTKENLSTVKKEIEMAQNTKIQINYSRNRYRSIAQWGSKLFFIFQDMASVSPMYQYSLSSFLHIFNISIITAGASEDLIQRLENVNCMLTLNLYEYGCLSLMKNDKLLFSFKIAISVEQMNGKLSNAEIDFISKPVFRTQNPGKCSGLTWINNNSWAKIDSLTKEFPDSFITLKEDLINNEKEWQLWCDSKFPENEVLPCNYSDILRPFQIILIIKCFRSDRLIQSVQNFVVATIGQPYIVAPPIDWMAIFQKSSATVPILLMLCPGSNPVPDLIKLSEECGMADGKFKQTSLGQGSDTIATTLLESAITQGQWLLLQNCHLLVSFIKKLEKRLSNLNDVHPDFRLWLTSEPISTFPTGLLQRSFKIVVEVPQGVKLNLKNTYVKLGPATLEISSHKHFKPLIFVLAFFHAIVQERRKYKSIGWNVNYDFNDTDFHVSLELLKELILKADRYDSGKLCWTSIKFLIGEIIYGGRVIDFFDRRVLLTYVNEYFGDFLFESSQTFYFFHHDKTPYGLPNSADYNQCLNYIENMPNNEDPAVFGLHPNAEIGYSTRCAKRLCRSLAKIQPTTTATTDEINKDSVIKNVCSEVLTKLPNKLDLIAIRKNFEMNSTPSTTVLLQEVARFNLLVDCISKSVSLLVNALDGKSEFNDSLEEMSDSLYKNELPSLWRKFIPNTMKTLGDWLTHFVRRTEQYNYWSINGDPMVMWLSGLHEPKAYLVSLIQMACRSNGWPLETGTLSTSVSEYVSSDQVERGLAEGCYIDGLFIEGARWDISLNRLEHSLPRILYEQMPVLKIIPVEKHQLRQLNTLRTPVYVTPLRTNSMGDGLAFEVDLTIKGHLSQWALNGICLLLNID